MYGGATSRGQPGPRTMRPCGGGAATGSNDDELESATEPIRGHLDDGRGAPIEFAGWLELMAALDAARGRAAVPGAGSAGGAR